MNTKPSALTPEEVDRLVKVLEARGGSVTIQDPRVSQVQAWVWAAIGAGVIAVGGWLVTSINDLNQTMARVAVTNEYLTKIIDGHERRLSDLERRKANEP